MTGLEKLIERMEKEGTRSRQYWIKEVRTLLAEESDNRTAGITMREPDVLDWKEHKEEFKAWLKGQSKPPANADLVGELNMLCGTFNEGGRHAVVPVYRVKEILSRYRPLPAPADGKEDKEKI